MAGKKRNQIDTMPMSKTAKASMAKKGKNEGFQSSGELSRVVSLDDGNWCYLRSPVSGALYHLRVGSFAYWDRLDVIRDTVHWDRVERELVELGFPVVNEAQEKFMAQVEANDKALFEALDRQEAE